MFKKHEEYPDLCKSLDKTRNLVFPLPHGNVGDTIVDGLHPYLEKGDVIVDASSEHVEEAQTPLLRFRTHFEDDTAHHVQSDLSFLPLVLLDLKLSFITNTRRWLQQRYSAATRQASHHGNLLCRYEVSICQTLSSPRIDCLYRYGCIRWRGGSFSPVYAVA